MSEISREVALMRGEYDYMLKLTSDEAVFAARLGASMGDGDIRELHYWVNAKRGGGGVAALPNGGNQPASGGRGSPWGAPPFVPGAPSSPPGLPGGQTPIPLPGFGGPPLPAPSVDDRKGGIGSTSELGQRIRKYVCGLNLAALSKSFSMWSLGAGAMGYRKLAALASTAALACDAAVVACAITSTDSFVNSWARLHAAVDEAGTQSSTAKGMAAATMAVWTASGAVADFRRDFPKVSATTLALIEMDSTVPIEKWDGPAVDTGQDWMSDQPQTAPAPVLDKPAPGGGAPSPASEPGKELPEDEPDEPHKELPGSDEGDDDDEGGKHAGGGGDDDTGWIDDVVDNLGEGDSSSDWGSVYNDVRSELGL